MREAAKEKKKSTKVKAMVLFKKKRGKRLRFKERPPPARKLSYPIPCSITKTNYGTTAIISPVLDYNFFSRLTFM